MFVNFDKFFYTEFQTNKESVADGFVEARIKEILNGKTREEADFTQNVMMLDVYNLIEWKRNKKYYLSTKAKDIINKIKVPQKFDWSLLGSIQKATIHILYDDKSFFSFSCDVPNEKMSHITCMYLEADATHLHFTGFGLPRLDKDDQIVGRSNDPFPPMVNFKNQQEVIDEAIRIISFLFFADTTEELLKPGSSVGTKKGVKLVNRTKFDIINVGSNWNINKVLDEKFGVSGHWRLQRYGTGLVLVKLIWIDAYEKQGYNLRAGKERDTGHKQNV